MADRPYQERTLNAIRDKIIEGHRRILCVLPTGGGKGYIAARVMEMAAGKGNTNAFFAAQRELVIQLNRQLERLSVPSQVIMRGVENEYTSTEEWELSGLCSVIGKDTLWSRAYKRKTMTLPSAKIVQIDEAHGSISKTYMAIMEDYSDSITIGWTATPCRGDGRDLGGYYDTMIQAASYKELQDLGFLVPVSVFAPDRPDLKKLSKTGGDYAKKALENRMNKDGMVGSIVREWRKNSAGRQTVLFAAGVDHSIHCRNEFRKIGVTAEHIDGKMSQEERDDIMSRALAGKVSVVCNYGVLHTGVDVPAWKYMICARPTKSFGLWRQMAGRIQRPFPGYSEAVIQDHSDNTLCFGYPDEDVDWTLDSDARIQDTHRKKQKNDGKEPLQCPSCKKVMTGKVCVCGFAFPEKKGKVVEMAAGELAKLERRKANRLAKPTDKEAYWKSCLGWAIGKDKKVGAAAHRYKDKFGCWPNNQIPNVPRGKKEWSMTGKEFYDDVVKKRAES